MGICCGFAGHGGGYWVFLYTLSCFSGGSFYFNLSLYLSKNIGSGTRGLHRTM